MDFAIVMRNVKKKNIVENSFCGWEKSNPYVNHKIQMANRKNSCEIESWVVLVQQLTRVQASEAVLEGGGGWQGSLIPARLLGSSKVRQ